MSGYNGHKNWNHWNVALWLFNDAEFYRLVQRRLRISTKDEAKRQLVACDLPPTTPDGVKFTFTAVRAALVGA